LHLLETIGGIKCTQRRAECLVSCGPRNHQQNTFTDEWKQA